MVTSLASYRRCCDRLAVEWPGFLNKRQERLAQQRRFGTAAEKVAENILEDLFTMVLDWYLSDVNNQVGYADLVLTRLGVKHLIVEVKRPGALAWNQRSVDAALAQAHRYADEQKVHSVAVSDGIMLYARDHVPGGHRDRVFVHLDQTGPPVDLWWLSTDGISTGSGKTHQVPASTCCRPHQTVRPSPPAEPGPVCSTRNTGCPRCASPTSATPATRRRGTCPTCVPMARRTWPGCPKPFRRSCLTTGALMSAHSRGPGYLGPHRASAAQAASPGAVRPKRYLYTIHEARQKLLGCQRLAPNRTGGWTWFAPP